MSLLESPGEGLAGDAKRHHRVPLSPRRAEAQA